MNPDVTLELLRAADPQRSAEPPTETEIELMLASVLGHAAAPEWSLPRARRRRRRLRAGWVAAAACLAAAVAVVVSLLPSGTPAGVGSAWAKGVIAKASASLLSGLHEPLYIDVTNIIHGGPSAKRRLIVSHEANWLYGTKLAQAMWGPRSRTRHPSQYVAVGQWIATYDAATNVIDEIRNPRGDPVVYNPVNGELLQLGVRVPLAMTVQGPAAVRRMMVALLHSRGITVRHAMLRGKPAIQLSDARWSGVIYLDPMTYAPREIYRTNVSGTASHGSETLIFNAYRTVAPAQLPRNVFDLRRQHPTAKFVHLNP